MSQENQMRIMVNYCDRNLAKDAGCKWDAEKKQWYCLPTISKTNLDKLINHQQNKKIAFVKRFVHRGKNEIDELNKQNIQYIDFDYRQVCVCVFHSEKEIREWHEKNKQGPQPQPPQQQPQPIVSYPFNKFAKTEKAPEKKAYFSNTVCNFCKCYKLSKEEIAEFNFVDVCSGCKIQYRVSQII